jgi:hypothetical protein
VTKVLAPALRVPGHYVESTGGRKTPTLGDFGEAPFTVLLPLTMLKEHVESDNVCVFGQLSSPMSTVRRVTPPSRASRESRDSLLNLLDDDSSDSEDDAEHIADYNPDNDEPRNEDDTGLDANNDVLQEHLNLIEEAAVAAGLAEKEGRVNLLFCEKLDDAPEIIKQIFSAVLGDIFHGMNQAKVPVRHEYKKGYYIAFMKAFLAWDPDRLKEVTNKLKENGFSDEDIEMLMYYHPSFFAKGVERIVLPPHQLYWRVRAVFVTFGSKVDSKSGKPLFNKLAWLKANNLLHEILLGLFLDPLGYNFYTLELDADGNPKTDKYGIRLIRCKRGTNAVESIHKYY